MHRSLMIALVVSLFLSACAAGYGDKFPGDNNLPMGQPIMPGA